MVPADIDRNHRDQAIHRRVFISDSIHRVVGLALAVKDEKRAKEIQEVVKSLYEFLSGVAPSNPALMYKALD